MILVNIAVIVLVGGLTIVQPAIAQPGEQSVALVVQAGRSFRVALDRRVTVKRAGQPIAGTLIEPLYAYDRVVVPAGTAVRSHVDRVDAAPKMARVRAMLGGDFSPIRRVRFEWDTFVLSDGREVPIGAVVTSVTERPVRRITAAAQTRTDAGRRSKGHALITRQKAEIAQRARDTLSNLKRPGKAERFRDAVVRRLPYHPQFLAKGTVLNAEMVSPVGFGTAIPIERAPAGVLPAPESILNVRLLTALDSSNTRRGAPAEGVVTEPVFSADRRLILPEGTVLHGEVTYAKRAAGFHRNGQLRFLFERVEIPGEDSATMLASLYSMETGGGDGVVIDEEGGARVTSSKTRFLAPVLALAALRGSMEHEGPHVAGSPVEASAGESMVEDAAGPRSLGGFLGFGLVGTALSQISPRVGMAFGFVAVGRTVYSTVFGKGRDVVLPTGTPLQLQLAPGPAGEP